MGAASWAAAVADTFAAPLQIVHATPDLGPPVSDAGRCWRAAVTAQRESAESMLKSVEEEIRADFGSLTITTTQFGRDRRQS